MITRTEMSKIRCIFAISRNFLRWETAVSSVIKAGSVGWCGSKADMPQETNNFY